MTKYSSPIIQYYPVEVTLDMHLKYRYYCCEHALTISIYGDIIDATEELS